LTGKKDAITGQEIGYRTRVVHLGDRIEKLVPDASALRKLFAELDGYIRRVMDHMIEHSEMTFADYLLVREALRPYQD